VEEDIEYGIYLRYLLMEYYSIAVCARHEEEQKYENGPSEG
jgi:hypothetical protein